MATTPAGLADQLGGFLGASLYLFRNRQITELREYKTEGEQFDPINSAGRP